MYEMVYLIQKYVQDEWKYRAEYKNSNASLWRLTSDIMKARQYTKMELDKFVENVERTHWKAKWRVIKVKKSIEITETISGEDLLNEVQCN